MFDAVVTAALNTSHGCSWTSGIQNAAVNEYKLADVVAASGSSACTQSDRWDMRGIQVEIQL
jgi:2-keto-3-deoxy-6-phosphogluconate aldolase